MKKDQKTRLASLNSRILGAQIWRIVYIVSQIKTIALEMERVEADRRRDQRVGVRSVTRIYVPLRKAVAISSITIFSIGKIFSMSGVERCKHHERTGCCQRDDVIDIRWTPNLLSEGRVPVSHG